MKKLLIIISTLFSQILVAQDSVTYKPFVYRIMLNTTTNNKAFDGYLSSLTDTSVSISSNAVRLSSYSNNSSRSTQIPFYNIDLLSIKRTGGTGRGALIGGIAGVLIGTLAGLTSGDDAKEGLNFFRLTAGEKAAMFGGLAGLSGVAVGALVGAIVQKTFIIKGRKENFDEFRRSVAL